MEGILYSRICETLGCFVLRSLPGHCHLSQLKTSLAGFCSDVFGKVSGLSIVTLDIHAKGKETQRKQ